MYTRENKKTTRDRVVSIHPLTLGSTEEREEERGRKRRQRRRGGGWLEEVDHIGRAMRGGLWPREAERTEGIQGALLTEAFRAGVRAGPYNLSIFLCDIFNHLGRVWEGLRVPREVSLFFRVFDVDPNNVVRNVVLIESSIHSQHVSLERTVSTKQRDREERESGRLTRHEVEEARQESRKKRKDAERGRERESQSARERQRATQIQTSTLTMTRICGCIWKRVSENRRT